MRATGFLTLCLAIFLMAPPVTAQGYGPRNREAVTPAGSAFIVHGDAGYGARGMWCIAADYAKRRLNAHGHQRLYIREGRAPGLGQRAGVAFTLDPTGLTPSSVLILGTSLRRPGANLSIDHAYSFCADLRGNRR
ncbi:hypothetical protein ACFSUD_02430 [Sulfitobacter aestuarii]|uniref:Uncharacterized protein n=1 Tax=Sulfitobacter aestuarii TaxID=2161676 RepID=A0ABW5U0V4_9RHOB